MLLISPPGKSFFKGHNGRLFQRGQKCSVGLPYGLPCLRPTSPTVCVFPRYASLDATCAKRNRVPLPYASKLFYQPARVRATWDAHLAIRRRGTHTEVIVNIVDVVVAVLIHAIRIIVVVRRTEPPPPGAQSFSTLSLYDEASRLTSPTVFCRCSAMRRAYFDNQRLSLLSARIALARYSPAP